MKNFAKVYLQPHRKNQDTNNGINMQQKLGVFFATIVISGFDLFSIIYISISLMDILSSGAP